MRGHKPIVGFLVASCDCNNMSEKKFSGEEEPETKPKHLRENATCVLKGLTAASESSVTKEDPQAASLIAETAISTKEDPEPLTTSKSRIKTLVTKDAPSMPQVLRMTLRDKSLWDKFIDSTKGMTPHKIWEALNGEKQRLSQKMKAGQKLTQEECDFLNKKFLRDIEKVLNNFKDRVLAELEITPKDTPETIAFKLELTEQFIEWLSDLFKWLFKKIKGIFESVKNEHETCMQEAKELFDFLWSLFK